MKHHVIAVLLAIGALCAAGPASSATLGLLTGAPNLSASQASIDFLFDDPFVPVNGDLSAFGAEVDSTNGVSVSGIAEIGFGVSYALSDPTTDLTGGFDVFDANGLVLGGDLFAVGFTEDVIELQFTNLSGSAAGSFGSSVLMVIAFEDPFDELGTNPFDDLVDGLFYDASITISTVVPIPLPAGLPLLLTGLVCTALIARRRTRVLRSRDAP